MVSDGWVEEREIIGDLGEASTVDEPDEERESELNGSENVGVGGSAMSIAVSSLWQRPTAMLELFGKPKPRPTVDPSAWSGLAHWELLRFSLGLGHGRSWGDSAIDARWCDDGLAATLGEAGTVGNEGVEVVDADTRLAVVEGVR